MHWLLVVVYEHLFCALEKICNIWMKHIYLYIHPLYIFIYTSQTSIVNYIKLFLYLHNICGAEELNLILHEAKGHSVNWHQRLSRSRALGSKHVHKFTNQTGLRDNGESLHGFKGQGDIIYRVACFPLQICQVQEHLVSTDNQLISWQQHG